jgi:hypothetical protein
MHQKVDGRIVPLVERSAAKHAMCCYLLMVDTHWPQGKGFHLHGVALFHWALDVERWALDVEYAAVTDRRYSM